MFAQRKRVRFPQIAVLALLFALTLATSLTACSLAAVSTQSKLYDPSLRYAKVDSLGLGTNLMGVADWSTQLPFIDSFKSSRSWITKCAPSEACGSTWSTDEADKLDLDARGWVKSLPAPADPPEYSRVATLLHNGLSRYPGGQYVVLYEGEGTIEYDFDAKKDAAASRPGRDLINVTPSGSGILLIVAATDPQKKGNYIRNIRVVPIKYEQSYATEIFNPLFLERIQQFGTLRFMDWMATNHSQQRDWQNRPQLGDRSYAEKGVPLEIMLELANRLRANPWFNMPHQATDDYFTQFAQLVKAKLDPKLTAYVEFSNEVWNWSFGQSQYALKQGKARWGEDKGDAYMQWYGMRTAQMSQIWQQVFGNQRSRIRTIISTQTAWKGLETSVLDCPLWVAEGHKPCAQQADAYAVSGYFSGGLGDDRDRAKVEAWLKEPDGGVKLALTQLEQGGGLQTDDSIAETMRLFNYHQQVAQQKRLKLVVYEGGQGMANPNSDKLTDFFIQLNRRPEMNGLYQKLLNNWKTAGGTLFMNFSDIGTPSKWGCWAVLEHVDQTSSPRYDALISFIRQNALR